jgi:hypothetical protein
LDGKVVREPEANPPGIQVRDELDNEKRARQGLTTRTDRAHALGLFGG